MNEKRLIIAYITSPSEEHARDLARTIVEERLAACANILPGMSSIYHWEGAICEDKEWIVLLKTQFALKEDLLARVKTLHSYTVPCVLFIPIQGGNPDYLQWLLRETTTP